jgi:hypothetical protein
MTATARRRRGGGGGGGGAADDDDADETGGGGEGACQWRGSPDNWRCHVPIPADAAAA